MTMWRHRQPVHCWHLARFDDRLGYGDERLVIAGRTIRVQDRPHIGERGLHASRSLAECLIHASGTKIWRVRVSGEVHETGHEIAATERTPLWCIDGADILLSFARRCAQEASVTWPGAEPESRFVMNALMDAPNLWSIVPLIGERLRQLDGIAGMQAAASVALFAVGEAHKAGSDRAVMRWIALTFTATLFAAGFLAEDYNAGWKQKFAALNDTLECEVWQRAFNMRVTTPHAERDWHLARLG